MKNQLLQMLLQSRLNLRFPLLSPKENDFNYCNRKMSHLIQLKLKK